MCIRDRYDSVRMIREAGQLAICQLVLLWVKQLMRVLGLDFGSKTTGVAVSDPLGFTAQGLSLIHIYCGCSGFGSRDL